MEKYQFIINFTDEEIMNMFREYYPDYEKDAKEYDEYDIDCMVNELYDFDSFYEFLENLCCMHEVSNAIYDIIKEKIENRG